MIHDGTVCFDESWKELITIMGGIIFDICDWKEAEKKCF